MGKRGKQDDEAFPSSFSMQPASSLLLCESVPTTCLSASLCLPLPHNAAGRHVASVCPVTDLLAVLGSHMARDKPGDMDSAHWSQKPLVTMERTVTTK